VRTKNKDKKAKGSRTEKNEQAWNAVFDVLKMSLTTLLLFWSFVISLYTRTSLTYCVCVAFCYTLLF
jgi:hypothetical protein